MPGTARLRLACVAACAALPALRPPPASAQYVEPSEFAFTGVFQAPGLTESSGVAVSRLHPGVLWTHNDSGERAVLYATDTSGADLGSLLVANARAVDWEDIALGPCPAVAAPCLYIADTGDNLERRPSVAIYVVPEPQRLPRPRTHLADTVTARRITVRYANGQQDVEAVAVTPQGEVLLISKGRRGPVFLYRIPQAQLASDSVVLEPAQELGRVPRGALGQQVTGAAVSPTGDEVVLRTYTQLLFFHLTEDRLVPRGEPCWLGIREAQGEAVDYLSAGLLVLTSEAGMARRGTIARVRCPMTDGVPRR